MNMIETVARAICCADEQNGAAPWEWYGTDAARLGYFDQAKSAINALREPSDAMLAAGVVHDDATYSTWIAMIDAALVDGE